MVRASKTIWRKSRNINFTGGAGPAGREPDCRGGDRHCQDRRSPGALFALAALFLLVFPLCPAARGAAAPAAPAAAPAGLADRLDAVLAGAPRLKAGIVVRRLADGETLYARAADEPFSLASNMKIITCAAALELLGADFRFRTVVGAAGRQAGERWEGDLVLVGGGDPNLSGRFHEGDVLAVPRGWAEAVAARGVREVSGRLVLDDTRFDREHVHPDWPDDQRTFWYCAPVGALSFNDNCVDITTGPGAAAGEPGRWSLSPPTDCVTLESTLGTTGDQGRHQVCFHRRPGTNRIRLWGEYLLGAAPRTDSITIDDPALFLGTVFRESLAAAGVTIAGETVLAPAPGELTVLAETVTGLDVTLPVILKRSQNFYAEQLFKTLGAEAAGEGSFAGGVRAVSAYLEGLGLEGFTVTDGSGLARDNALTPRQVAAVLVHLARGDEARFTLFRESLPVAGVDGTLSRRLGEDGARGRVQAKTGYIRGVSALSGYLDTAGEGRLAFSFLMASDLSNSRMKRLQDDLCRALLAWGDGEAAP